MRGIEAVRTRLAATEGLADTLATGWDVFALVQAVTDDWADRMPATFAAFMLAAACAASGRDALGFAPSMPSSPGAPIVCAGLDGTGIHEAAGQLAGLASALAVRLHAAAGHARDWGDRQACEQAACLADSIGDLLGPGR